MTFYSLDKVISYNIPVNIIITERGYGKSYSVKKYVIDRFLKHHEEFMYIRRYDNEIKNVFEKSKGTEKDFFQDIKQNYPDIKLFAKDKKFFIQKQDETTCFGYAKRMTEYQDLKSGTFSNIKTIIIDEYPIEKGKRYYLPNEGMILMNIFDSIIRNRSDIKIFILGNAVEGLEFSPLFNFFELSLPYGKKDIKLFKDNTILVQYATSSEFRKEREQTLIGKLAKGTPYEEYAIQNKILDKNNDFIGKKSNGAKFIFSLIYNKKKYGVWNDYNEGMLFISNDVDPYNPYCFALTVKDHTPNTMLIIRAKTYNQLKFLIEQYRIGNVYYESQKIKSVSQEIFRLLL